MKVFTRIVLAIVLSAISLVATGQALSKLEGDELLMGNTMKLRIEVPVPSDTSKVSFPLINEAAKERRKYVPLLNDSVELLTSYRRALETEGEKLIMRFDLTVQAFDSGRYELPPFEFIVDGKSVTTNSVILNVLPVKAKSDDKIDDFTSVAAPFEVNPQLEEELNQGKNLFIWYIIAVILLLAIVGGCLYLYRKRSTIFPFAKPVPIYKQALDRLDKLEGKRLPDKGKTKEYYTRLADILRFYMNRQFGIKTFEKTSTEILYQIEREEYLNEYVKLLKSIFDTSDYVKFAKASPTVEENQRCLKDTRKFIEISHPTDQNKEGVAK